ncbi:MAG: ArsA family ATPase [Nocardioidaceae bacterium]
MTGRARTSPRSSRSKPRVGGATGRHAGEHHLDVDALLDDPETQIIVCCGSGGVGKTTTAASLALRAAEQGRSVCVLTIDPARRLAQSMGLSELDNVPRPVKGAGADGGSLDAMMLDMKRTFDEVVEAHASPQKAAQILRNPFYVALSSSFAGTQEYMAMEKLGQLHAEAGADADGAKRWDLIVVDTPPSRSALDFLDAPEHLSSLLDGRFVRLLLAPAKGPVRLFSAGFGIVTSALNKVLGAQVLTDVQTFVAAFDTLFGGFRQRAEATYALLQADGTAFVVLASPEPDAMREATYFVERLTAERMPLAGLVVNRVTEPEAELDADEGEAAARALDALGEERTEADSATAGLLRIHAARMRIRSREDRLKRRFGAAHPQVATLSVPALAGDVHDLDGLRTIGELLAG